MGKSKFWHIISGPGGPPNNVKGSIRNTCARSISRSVGKTSKYNISKQDFLRSLDPLARNAWEISLQELSTKSLEKTSLSDLYRRSPDIPGPPGKTSMGDLSTKALYKISWSPGISGPLAKTFIRDLFTRTLYKTSSQDLYERSLYNISWYLWTFWQEPRSAATLFGEKNMWHWRL